MEFKVGDRVKNINDKGYYYGKIGVISKIANYGYAVNYIGNCRTTVYAFCNYQNFIEPIKGDANPNKIVITTNGTETIARLFDNNKQVKTASAKCAESDTYDFNVGAKLAMERLLDVGVREVKRKALVGEYVKIVNASNHSCNEYKNGDILKIIEKTGEASAYAYYKDLYDRCLYESEYVVLKNYIPSKPIEPVKPLYNGKVVCYESNSSLFTKGRMYEFKDGVVTFDNGYEDMYIRHSFEDVERDFKSKFVEYVEGKNNAWLYFTNENISKTTWWCRN